ncbi:MAG: nucleotidyltransferase domain-containing protein [Bacilli bacterium]|nr:nucleotidyltransferase domain-containing protein [Bacilli bacterium]
MNKKRANYISKFNKDNYKMYLFRVKKCDIELINKLDNVPNRNSYLTNLVLEDIKPDVLTIKQIKESINPIMERHGIKNVYLFGSYARGEATRESDVDIYCDSGDVDSLWKHSAFQDELADALGKDADVITIGSQMDDYFKQQLEKDMVKIC